MKQTFGWPIQKALLKQLREISIGKNGKILVDWQIADFVASWNLIQYLNKAITLFYIIREQEIYLIDQTSINEYESYQKIQDPREGQTEKWSWQGKKSEEKE